LVEKKKEKTRFHGLIIDKMEDIYYTAEDGTDYTLADFIELVTKYIKEWELNNVPQDFASDLRECLTGQQPSTLLEEWGRDLIHEETE